MTDPTPNVAQTARRGALGIVVFWLALMGMLYLAFDHFEQGRSTSNAAYANDQGDLVIPRGRDGHFRVQGQVNGQAVTFLVDTGASTVTVSENFARRANLEGGQSVTFQTANGPLQGRVLRQVPVQAGHLGLNGTTVAVGLVGLDNDKALLGQSFLSRFDIQILQGEMRLTPR
ncbi:retropepsin-like aspartic protease family protein [Hydrogenophaga sp.]|uniref:retropepsin-like aspartic protease family protein n=1 Tax=Hydrogenophaga sp. TaxID=1904254 RepID=UPI002737618B|nr:TIGR02281 family clan AA aspartic protease [Hydrogenophaga sp.]MDP1780460.1 TIGR02281 family clan AA aspartic protease [Hydrogenophaga sp.]MDP3348409.1 TIGR02281 family clan AA aspartic protease [Hydrogenophaga sp.]MDZ4399441.1 TIGR02281 family clan AA aspartic protease [Hydrogenophaga sp.]